MISLELGERIKPLKKWAISELARRGTINWFGGEVAQRLDNITSVRWATPEAKTKFLDLTAQDMVPEIFGAHFIHLELNFTAIGFSWLQQEAQQHGLGGKLEGAIATIAKSVTNGKQDPFMEAIYPQVEGHARSNNVEFFPVTREKDEDVYDMTKEEEEAEVLSAKVARKGIATIVMPYGSIQPGRHLPGTPRGAIDGMKALIEPVDSPREDGPKKGDPKRGLFQMYSLMEFGGRAHGQHPYFLPLAIRRSYRAQSPDSYLPTPEGIISIYPRLAKFLSVVGFRPLEVELIFCEPVTREDLRAAIGPTWKTAGTYHRTNRFLMERIAPYQLPQERGEFAYIGE